MAQADWSSRVVFLPNAIVHNPPENPNVVLSWQSYLSEIPECELKLKALAVLRAFMEAKGKAWGKPSRRLRFVSLRLGLQTPVSNAI